MRSLKNGYILKKDWDESIFVQGDDEGIVFSKDEVETVSFFEVFPNDPKTFIRGEGITLEDAENSAWNKYQRIINCKNHKFKRIDSSNHAECIKCNLFQSNILKSINSCSVCNKKEVYIVDYESKKYLCIEDFIKLNEEMINTQNENFIEKINQKDFHIFKINRVKYLKITKLIEEGLIEINEEYKLDRILDNKFSEYLHKYLISSINNIPEFKFHMLSFKYLSDYLIFFQEIYNNIYINFINENEKTELLSKNFINKFAIDYDIFFVKKYGTEFKRKIINL